MKKTFLLLISLAFAFVVSAQSRQVSGVVTASDDGSPLTGVTVMVKGLSGVGTITDIDGKFSIKVPDGKSLAFSYIGYTPQLIVINKDVQLKVLLVPDSKMLDEVVAIGYGTMKKSDLTGSVSSVGADKMKERPVSGIDQALQGRATVVNLELLLLFVSAELVLLKGILIQFM